MIARKGLFCMLSVVNFQAISSMDAPQNPQEVERIKSLLVTIGHTHPQQTTSVAQRRKYGYNGQIIPIIQGRYADRPTLPLQDACIISGAQPSAFFGLRYLESHIFSTRFFFKYNNALFGGEIKERAATQEEHTQPFSGPAWECTTGIKACCTAYDNQLALLWEDRPHTSAAKLFITLIKMQNIIKERIINLDENKIELKNQSQPLYQP